MHSRCCGPRWNWLPGNTVDDEGRVLTLDFGDHATIVVDAPCTTWGKPEVDAKRILFQQYLLQHCLKWNKRKPTFITGDGNVAPTDQDCTVAFPLPVGVKEHSVDALGRHVLRSEDVASTKPLERQLHQELLDKCGLTDGILGQLGDKPRPITWAKTGKAFTDGEGLRIDHVLAPQSAMDATRFPHLHAAQVDGTCNNSDHSSISFEVVRAPQDPATATIEVPFQALALVPRFGGEADPAAQRRAFSRISRKLGDRLPPLPAAPADAWITLALLAAEADSLDADEDDAETEVECGPQDPSEAEEISSDEDTEEAERRRTTNIVNAIGTYAAKGGTHRRNKVLPEIAVTINGATFTCLLDSGAEKSIMSKAAAASAGLTLLPCPDDAPPFELALLRHLRTWDRVDT